MDEIIHVLWEYASQYRLDGCYDAGSQRRKADCEQMLVRNRTELERLCSPEARQRLDTLCDHWEEIRAEDLEAAFTCGLRLGLALR